MTEAAERKSPSKRSAGAYSVQGKKVRVVQSKDKHKLWDDLFSITESQISGLKQKIDMGGELDHREMQKLASCYAGMMKLLEIEAQLKSDAISSMTNEDLMKIARKVLREKPKNDSQDKATGP